MKFLQSLSLDAMYICVSDVVVNLHTKKKYMRDTSDQSPVVESAGVTIVSICISNDQTLLLAAYSNKFIYCFDLSDGRVIGKLLMKKKPTALVHMSLVGYGDSKGGIVLVSDKEGSVSALSCPTLSKQVVVGGHTASIITDMDSVTSSISSSKDSLNFTNIGLVATADRDEKIRISQFPHFETIQRYCLGHKSVVTSVSFLKSNSSSKALLVSCGWDRKILLWDASSGDILDSIDVETGREGAAVQESSSSSSSRNAAVEVIKERAENDDEEDGNVAEEKTYDSAGAGNYPLKLVVSKNSDIIAAIYFGLNKVDVFSVVTTAERTSKFGRVKSFDLPDTPVDISFVADADKLVVLLPKPHLLAFVTIRLTAQEVESIVGDVSTDTAALIKEFSNIVSTIDTFTDFKQQLILSGNDGTTAEAGIKKHSMIGLHEKHMQDFTESVKKKKQKK